MKKRRHPLRKKPRKKRHAKPAKPTCPPRPRQVYVAVHKLLATTNHIHARAAELETALAALREYERSQALKELLLALRNSPDGDLLRFNPAAPSDGANNTAQAIIGALVDAFSITPTHNIGDRIALRDGQIPDALELDRPIGDEPEQCVTVEVVSVGWSYHNATLLKPLVRPLFAATLTTGAAEANGSGTTLESSSSVPLSSS